MNIKQRIEEGLGNYMVLKICLQPLVENALYSGIKESDQDRRNYMDPCFFRVRGFDHT